MKTKKTFNEDALADELRPGSAFFPPLPQTGTGQTKNVTPQTFEPSMPLPVEEASLESLTVQSPETSATQSVDTSTPQPVQSRSTRRSKVQTAKRSKVERVQQTAWIPPDLARWLRLQAVQEDREISEIVTDALTEYLDKQGNM